MRWDPSPPSRIHTLCTSQSTLFLLFLLSSFSFSCRVPVSLARPTAALLSVSTAVTTVFPLLETNGVACSYYFMAVLRTATF